MRASVARWVVRAGVVGLLATAASWVASPAGAHATAVAESPVQGGWSILSVRVPTESETASTIRVEVTFPLDTPVPAVRTSPLVGWTATVTVEDLPQPLANPHGGQYTQAVSRVVWETTDPHAAIGPGEYGEFAVQAGPLPAVTELVLPTVQGYDDGTEARWIDRSADGTEADHPVPSIALSGPVDAAGTVGAVGAVGAAHHAGAGPEVGAAGDTASGPGTAVVALAALAASLAALVAVALVWRRTGVGTTPSSSGPVLPDDVPGRDGLGEDPAVRPRAPRTPSTIGLPPL
ncbi:YcnI family protein [Oerskovia sp. NPDC056781]|uniref:YcnI family copper-binding membrane protein n=1 Tax=Oerskovia sp. NPDC056781 TaxID=3345942 RepID=UPI00366E37A0